MRSQLTRGVFRKLISGEPLVLHCHSYHNCFSCHRPRYASPVMIRPPLKRTVFGMFNSKKNLPLREPSVDPGLPTMLDLTNMSGIGARPPPATELRRAWRKYFKHKLKVGEPVNRLQAEHVLQTFQHLKTLNSSNSEERLDATDLRDALDAFAKMPNDTTDLHNQLGKAFYAELEQTAEKTHAQEFKTLVQILCFSGDVIYARDLVQKEITDRGSSTQEISRDDGSRYSHFILESLHCVLNGFAREGNETELMNTLKMAEQVVPIYDSRVQQIMITFYAERDNVKATKYWYKKPLSGSSTMSSQTLDAILELSIRKDKLEWCKSVFKEVLEVNPTKTIWDVVIKWAAGVMGKGVEDVEHIIEVMIKRNQHDESVRPDIDTINSLVGMAMSKKDPYLAERYLALGVKFGIKPNAKTYLLQMEYRIDAHDLRGAHSAYEALQAEEILNDEDLPPVNKYIRALCAIAEPNFDLITSLTSSLDEREKRLEASTITALSLVYLDRREIDDLINLLQSNCYHYTLEERADIRDSFLKFICDRNNSTLKAWDAYLIMRKLFSETRTAQRTQIMKSFFERRRCDMACHTFGHMRQEVNQRRKPVLATYVACFEGIAALHDREHLELVHNMLKLDPNIEPNTQLYNALMLAYTSVGQGNRALDFWEDITNSQEGPSYKSLEIVFRACQETSWGHEKAREIWGKMRRMGVEVTGPVFAEYLAALAKNGYWEEVKGLAHSMEAEFGLKLDMMTLGKIYNAIPGDHNQDMMEAWCLEHYPEILGQLRKLGRRRVQDLEFPEVRTRIFSLKSEYKAS